LVSSGGVISAKEVQISATNTIFDNNSAEYGGVILANTDVTLAFDNCTFTNNKASIQGGVIFGSFNTIISTTD
jgi:predicted outer membrane repeat protein